MGLMEKEVTQVWCGGAGAGRVENEEVSLSGHMEQEVTPAWAGAEVLRHVGQRMKKSISLAMWSKKSL